MPPRADDPRRLILWTIVALATATATVWALYLVRDILLLIYVSLLLAIGFSPVVRLIEMQRLLPVLTTARVPRWLAILVLYLLILSSLVGIGLIILPPLTRQAQELWRELPQMLDRGQDLLIQWGVVSDRITLRDAFQRAPAMQDAAGTVFSAIWGVLGGIFGVVTVLILTFYFLVEGQSLFEGLLRLFPPSRRGRIDQMAREITVKVSAWLTGQLLLAFIIGSTALFFLWLLGVPYFYVLALLAAIGEMIPVIGPILAAIPGIIVGFTVSVKIGLAVAAFYVLQQQLENHILVPKVMQRQVGIAATTVIVALLIGGSLLGLLGAILAIPTAAVLQVLVQELTAESAGEDARS